MRIYRIAKECNCKFYLGSDSHKTEDLKSTKRILERAVTLLDLTEDDKLIL